jgi:hypothetical protein
MIRSILPTLHRISTSAVRELRKSHEDTRTHFPGMSPSMEGTGHVCSHAST